MPRYTNRRSSRASIPVYRPSSPTLTSHKPLSELSRAETITWLESLRSRLEQKQQRERAYLDRRAARGTHTPTDDTYQADQGLETELLTLLDELLHHAQEQGEIP